MLQQMYNLTGEMQRQRVAKNVEKGSRTIQKLEIASRRSLSPDGTWLKCDIRSIMVDTNIPLWGGGISVYGSNLY